MHDRVTCGLDRHASLLPFHQDLTLRQVINEAAWDFFFLLPVMPPVYSRFSVFAQDAFGRNAIVLQQPDDIQAPC